MIIGTQYNGGWWNTFQLWTIILQCGTYNGSNCMLYTVAGDDDDVIMSDWLVMVQKKNELVREESQLIYRLH